ncbi:hypothetical protein BDP27DRAFT_1319756 [Rhodocollybia butyracea]|uniref:Uncharacterized protein n=1 Tax=Rhodocollybia butyracea TaxID=206335 RepID=A0A9P5Q3M3_9AGAR|nr:hypothetical protein BDP27DRAFT_1319756 [Rhodocollybia butyracea]
MITMTHYLSGSRLDGQIQLENSEICFLRTRLFEAETQVQSLDEELEPPEIHVFTKAPRLGQLRIDEADGGNQGVTILGSLVLPWNQLTDLHAAFDYASARSLYMDMFARFKNLVYLTLSSMHTPSASNDHPIIMPNLKSLDLSSAHPSYVRHITAPVLEHLALYYLDNQSFVADVLSFHNRSSTALLSLAITAPLYAGSHFLSKSFLAILPAFFTVKLLKMFYGKVEYACDDPDINATLKALSYVEGRSILLPNLVSFEYHQNWRYHRDSRYCPLELVPMVLSRRIPNQPAATGETRIQRLQKVVLDFRLEEETKQIVGIPGLELVYSERNF